MNRLFAFIAVFVLASCSVVTLPIKVATKTVETAVDVTATTVDIITPDGDDDDKEDKEGKPQEHLLP